MEDMNETSGIKEPPKPQELLGEYLKEKRLEKNYSLEKLSQKTKISVNILKALELNDYKHLPSAAYIKGFVTSYVKVLNLPLGEAINKMEYTYLNILGKPFPALNHTKNMATVTSVVAPVAKATSLKELPEGPQDVINDSKTIMENTKSFLPVAIFAAVILIFIGGYRIVSSVVENETTDTRSKDLGPKIESSSALVKQPVKKEEPAPVLTTGTAAPAVTPPPVEVKPEEPKVEPPPIARNFPNIDFKKYKSKLFSVKTDAPENDDVTAIPENIKASMKSDQQNVYLKAHDGNTWLSYKIDNGPIQSVIISKDKDLFLQGQEIRLFVGNVNVTKIFYNNYLIDAPTKSGVKSLIFPEESREKYYMPLFPKAKDDILYTAEDYMKRMKLEQEELEKKKP